MAKVRAMELSRDELAELLDYLGAQIAQSRRKI
jgi:hypothetical protein